MTLRVIVQVLHTDKPPDEIGHLEIENMTHIQGVATDTNDFGDIADYRVIGPNRIGVVKGHRRSEGFWPLVKRALDFV